MTDESLPLSPAELDELESRVDAAFAHAQLPTDNRYSSRWAVLRTYEDQLRFALLRAAEAASDPEQYRQAVSRIIMQADAYKYALKASLDEIDRRLPDEPPKRVPRGDADDAYTRAGDFGFMSARAYNAASLVFSAVRGGSRSLLRTPDGRVRLSRQLEERTYGAMEPLFGADDEVFSPIPFLVAVFGGPSFYDASRGSKVAWGPEIKAVVARTDVHKGRVKYQFIFALAREFIEIFKQDKPDLPPSWQFPWGSLSDVSDVFAALATRAFYHLLAINFGADRGRLLGGGVDQICLETDLKVLANEVAQVTRLPIEKVAQVLSALTYGNGMRTPDPALQPLIPVGEGRILLPPFLVLTSAWGRNMLSLHARLDPRSFNAQSHLFELQMVKHVADEVQDRWTSWPNRHLPTKPRREEIDLILADPASRTLLLCELRWMIQPGDPREVYERQKACHEKVRQALRKRDAVRANWEDVQADLRLPPGERWRVEALVIIDNFGGVASSLPKEIPIVPRKVFEGALSAAPSLDHLHAAFTSADWLPREGADFHSHYEPVDLGGFEVDMQMFEMGDQAYIRDNVGRYLGASYSRTPEDLRREPW